MDWHEWADPDYWYLMWAPIGDNAVADIGQQATATAAGNMPTAECVRYTLPDVPSSQTGEPVNTFVRQLYSLLTDEGPYDTLTCPVHLNGKWWVSTAEYTGDQGVGCKNYIGHVMMLETNGTVAEVSGSHWQVDVNLVDAMDRRDVPFVLHVAGGNRGLLYNKPLVVDSSCGDPGAENRKWNFLTVSSTGHPGPLMELPRPTLDIPSGTSYSIDFVDSLGSCNGRMYFRAQVPDTGPGVSSGTATYQLLIDAFDELDMSDAAPSHVSVLRMPYQVQSYVHVDASLNMQWAQSPIVCDGETLLLWDTVRVSADAAEGSGRRQVDARVMGVHTPGADISPLSETFLASRAVEHLASLPYYAWSTACPSCNVTFVLRAAVYDRESRSLVVPIRHRNPDNESGTEQPFPGAGEGSTWVEWFYATADTAMTYADVTWDPSHRYPELASHTVPVLRRFRPFRVWFADEDSDLYNYEDQSAPERPDIERIDSYQGLGPNAAIHWNARGGAFEKAALVDKSRYGAAGVGTKHSAHRFTPPERTLEDMTYGAHFWLPCRTEWTQWFDSNFRVPESSAGICRVSAGTGKLLGTVPGAGPSTANKRLALNGVVDSEWGLFFVGADLLVGHEPFIYRPGATSAQVLVDGERALRFMHTPTPSRRFGVVGSWSDGYLSKGQLITNDWWHEFMGMFPVDKRTAKVSGSMSWSAAGYEYAAFMRPPVALPGAGIAVLVDAGYSFGPPSGCDPVGVVNAEHELDYFCTAQYSGTTLGGLQLGRIDFLRYKNSTWSAGSHENSTASGALRVSRVIRYEMPDPARLETSISGMWLMRSTPTATFPAGFNGLLRFTRAGPSGDAFAACGGPLIVGSSSTRQYGDGTVCSYLSSPVLPVVYQFTDSHILTYDIASGDLVSAVPVSTSLRSTGGDLGPAMAVLPSLEPRVIVPAGSPAACKQTRYTSIRNCDWFLFAYRRSATVQSIALVPAAVPAGSTPSGLAAFAAASLSRLNAYYSVQAAGMSSYSATVNGIPLSALGLPVSGTTASLTMDVVAVARPGQGFALIQLAIQHSASMVSSGSSVTMATAYDWFLLLDLLTPTSSTTLTGMPTVYDVPPPVDRALLDSPSSADLPCFQGLTGFRFAGWMSWAALQALPHTLTWHADLNAHGIPCGQTLFIHTKDPQTCQPTIHAFEPGTVLTGTQGGQVAPGTWRLVWDPMAGEQSVLSGFKGWHPETNSRWADTAVPSRVWCAREISAEKKGSDSLEIYYSDISALPAPFLQSLGVDKAAVQPYRAFVLVAEGGPRRTGLQFEERTFWDEKSAVFAVDIIPAILPTPSPSPTPLPTPSTTPSITPSGTPTRLPPGASHSRTGTPTPARAGGTPSSSPIPSTTPSVSPSAPLPGDGVTQLYVSLVLPACVPAIHQDESSAVNAALRDVLALSTGVPARFITLAPPQGFDPTNPCRLATSAAALSHSPPARQLQWAAPASLRLGGRAVQAVASPQSPNTINVVFTLPYTLSGLANTPVIVSAADSATTGGFSATPSPGTPVATIVALRLVSAFTARNSQAQALATRLQTFIAAMNTVLVARGTPLVSAAAIASGSLVEVQAMPGSQTSAGIITAVISVVAPSRVPVGGGGTGTNSVTSGEGSGALAGGAAGAAVVCAACIGFLYCKRDSICASRRRRYSASAGSGQAGPRSRASSSGSQSGAVKAAKTKRSILKVSQPKAPGGQSVGNVGQADRLGEAQTAAAASRSNAHMVGRRVYASGQVYASNAQAGRAADSFAEEAEAGASVQPRELGEEDAKAMDRDQDSSDGEQNSNVAIGEVFPEESVAPVRQHSVRGRLSVRATGAGTGTGAGEGEPQVTEITHVERVRSSSRGSARSVKSSGKPSPAKQAWSALMATGSPAASSVHNRTPADGRKGLTEDSTLQSSAPRSSGRLARAGAASLQRKSPVAVNPYADSDEDDEHSRDPAGHVSDLARSASSRGRSLLSGFAAAAAGASERALGMVMTASGSKPGSRANSQGRPETGPGGGRELPGQARSRSNSRNSKRRMSGKSLLSVDAADGEDEETVPWASPSK